MSSPERSGLARRVEPPNRYPREVEDADVSVLIATRGRADHLRTCLPSVLESAARSAYKSEVVVVDNGSVDRTAEVLDSLAADYPVLRVLFEPVPGQCRALNRALAMIGSEAVLFTDDDVVVPVSWVDDMAGPIISGEADAVCGRVVLAEHLSRPWLSPALRVCLAELLDVSGTKPGMVGANMATSLVAARAVGFDEELGPGARGFDSDVMFNLRLKSQGYRLVGSVGPPVEHHLDESRLTYESMVDLAVRGGRSHAYLWHHQLDTTLGYLRLRWLRDRSRLAVVRARNRSAGRLGGAARTIDEREFFLTSNVAFFQSLWQIRAQCPSSARGTARTHSLVGLGRRL